MSGLAAEHAHMLESLTSLPRAVQGVLGGAGNLVSDVLASDQLTFAAATQRLLGPTDTLCAERYEVLDPQTFSVIRRVEVPGQLQGVGIAISDRFWLATVLLEGAPALVRGEWGACVPTRPTTLFGTQTAWHTLVPEASYLASLGVTRALVAAVNGVFIARPRARTAAPPDRQLFTDAVTSTQWVVTLQGDPPGLRALYRLGRSALVVAPPTRLADVQELQLALQCPQSTPTRPPPLLDPQDRTLSQAGFLLDGTCLDPTFLTLGPGPSRAQIEATAAVPVTVRAEPLALWQGPRTTVTAHVALLAGRSTQTPPLHLTSTQLLRNGETGLTYHVLYSPLRPPRPGETRATLEQQLRTLVLGVLTTWAQQQPLPTDLELANSALAMNLQGQLQQADLFGGETPAVSAELRIEDHPGQVVTTATDVPVLVPDYALVFGPRLAYALGVAQLVFDVDLAFVPWAAAKLNGLAF